VPAITIIERSAIDATLAALLSSSRAVLGDALFGMYLSGSLASGGFDAATSDIDFVAVTIDDPIARQAELAALNREIQQTASPWAARLEGSFLPRHVFDDFNPAGAMFPTIGMGGWFGLDHKGIERALQRFVLREHGIALTGPPPRSFIAPVGPDALRAETRDVLHGWWRAQHDDPARLRRRGYQAYAVLTMCRTLYTLETGGVASKPAAAQWARPHLAAPWRGLVDRALAWRDRDGVDDLALTLDLIGWMLRHTAGGGGGTPAPRRVANDARQT
jgi:hypothetical protein